MLIIISTLVGHGHTFGQLFIDISTYYIKCNAPPNCQS